jgi:hypothetical protein
MGIYATDLRELIIRPTLLHLNDWSLAAENLLIGTAAQESLLAFRIRSNDTKKLGLFQISADTHTRIWDEYIVLDPEIASRLRGLASQQQFLKSPHNELATNLSYATGVAWMIYKQRLQQLPEHNNIKALAQCWADYYCTKDQPESTTNKPTEKDLADFVSHYRKLVLREHKKIAA